MKRGQWIRLFIAFAMVLSNVCAIAALADEKKDETKVTLPDSVTAAFHKAYAHAEIRSISTEIEDGKTYYEIESTDGNIQRDLLYKSDGTVFEIEESMAGSDLPAPITKSLKTKYPNGKIVKAERITQGDVTEYEVRLENGDDNIEILLDANGTIKSMASRGEENEQPDSGEGDETDED